MEYEVCIRVLVRMGIRRVFRDRGDVVGGIMVLFRACIRRVFRDRRDVGESIIAHYHPADMGTVGIVGVSGSETD